MPNKTYWRCLIVNVNLMANPKNAMARAYQPQISPKWIAEDGKSFWLVWTDFQNTSEFAPTLGKAFAAKRHEDFMRLMIESRRHRPYYAFNAQRVDLDIV